VFSDADVKNLPRRDPDERARRRATIGAQRQPANVANVASAMQARDQADRDKRRVAADVAPERWRIDTTHSRFRMRSITCWRLCEQKTAGTVAR